MSRILLTAASRVGCVRSNNEDMVLAYDKLVRSDAYETEFMTENTERFIIAVADGMGGHRAGEVASELVMENLKFYVNDLPRKMTPDELNERMVEWLHSINNTVNARGNADPQLHEMGTTLVGVLYYEGRYFWLNCGDSRLYRLRDRKLTQITTDHSLNEITGEKKHSNVITNCIGANCKQLFMDVVEMTGDVLPGDSYLLCSDGLNDMLPHWDIERMMCQHVTANWLCEAAIQAGGFDNVSTVVFRVEE